MKPTPTAPVIVAPSNLLSDFARLEDEAVDMKRFVTDCLHVDCMDGNLVPNLIIGACVVSLLRQHTNMYLDFHLLVKDPGQWVDSFAKAGDSGFTFNLESYCTDVYDKKDFYRTRAR